MVIKNYSNKEYLDAVLEENTEKTGKELNKYQKKSLISAINTARIIFIIIAIILSVIFIYDIAQSVNSLKDIEQVIETSAQISKEYAKAIILNIVYIFITIAIASALVTLCNIIEKLINKVYSNQKDNPQKKSLK